MVPVLAMCHLSADEATRELGGSLPLDVRFPVADGRDPTSSPGMRLTAHVEHRAHAAAARP
jgi:hypothetical protein